MARTSKKVSAQAEEAAPVEGSTEAAVSGSLNKATVKKVVIQPLTLDFNKEDLNTVVKKINEIITYCNEKVS